MDIERCWKVENNHENWITKSHRKQGLDCREAEELSWYPSWSNSLWQGWSCGLVHCLKVTCIRNTWTFELRNSFKKFKDSPRKKSTAEYFCCSNTISLFINQEKSELVYPVLLVILSCHKMFNYALLSWWGLELIKLPSLIGIPDTKLFVFMTYQPL